MLKSNLRKVMADREISAQSVVARGAGIPPDWVNRFIGWDSTQRPGLHTQYALKVAGFLDVPFHRLVIEVPDA